MVSYMLGPYAWLDTRNPCCQSYSTIICQSIQHGYVWVSGVPIGSREVKVEYFISLEYIPHNTDLPISMPYPRLNQEKPYTSQ